MNDEERALAAADAMIAEHGWPWTLDDGRVGRGTSSTERARNLLALAYLQGLLDGIRETKSLADAAFARLADDLRAVTP